MKRVKQGVAAGLLLFGVWALGRAAETAINPNPDLINRREIVTAGVLLGGPATAAAGWLGLDLIRQRRREQAQRLQGIFFELLQAGDGNITPLRFAMVSHLSGEAAKAYLTERAREYDATFQVAADGGLIYCFNLGQVDGRLLESVQELRFDVILETVSEANRREVVRIVQQLTGLEWKAVKALVKTVPQTIQADVGLETARTFQREISAVGARVILALKV